MLLEKGYTKENGYFIEEQKSDNLRIQKCLKNASKKGEGVGKPEFLITHKDYQDLLLVVECKADLSKHESESGDCFADFAVDGVKLYASYLSKEFNVISIALSGENRHNIKFSSFLNLLGSPTQTLYNNIKNTGINELLSFKEYDDILHYDPKKQIKVLADIKTFARKLHDYIYSNIPIEEGNKTLLVSAVILGLESQHFSDGYLTVDKDKKNRLCEELNKTVAISLENAGIPEDKSKLLKTIFSFLISNKDILQKYDEKAKMSVLANVITMIKNEVYPYLKKYSEVDFIGKFYNEFIRYTGGDGKGLGIVLTPNHITEFMADLIQVDANSIVLDTCTGTGGFLISAMYKMIDDINKSIILTQSEKENKIKHIKEKQLIGVEQQPRMFALACSNMYFKGDGKTNIKNGSCFDFDKKLYILDVDYSGNDLILKPNKALINPPYAQDNQNLMELDFIYFTLNQLQEGGKLACIVPISTGKKNENLVLQKKEKILSTHRLDAVITMPDQLFYPVGTNTCIMIFSAFTKHNDNHQTYLSSIKEDGFRISKGTRVDDENKWESIKNSFLIDFINNNINHNSLKKHLSFECEWLFESHYQNINFPSEDDFINTIKKYVAFKVVNGD